jgi:hypothetical protein
MLRLFLMVERQRSRERHGEVPAEGHEKYLDIPAFCVIYTSSVGFKL